MASAHLLLERLESTIGRYRDTIAQLTPELAHLREEKEIVMQYMSEMGSALKTLISDRQASDARANAAEAQVTTLKAQIAADEATLKGMLDATNEEISDETPAPSRTTPVVTFPASGATVTVDPAAGTTTHVDPVTSTTTTVDHETGTATATDASGAAVEPAPAAVTEATAATTAAGVDVPAAS